MIKLLKHNKKLYGELTEEYKKHDKVAVVVATGVGKTYLMLKFIEDGILSGDVKRVLILSPSSAIMKEHKKYDCWNPDFDSVINYMTFQKLIKVKDINSVESLNNLDIIVVDEAHRLGAKEWRKTYEMLIGLESNKGAKILGLTATPIRYTDKGLDVVEEFFDGVSVGNIHVSEAINEGIVNKPVLVKSIFNTSELKNDILGLIKNSDYSNLSNSVLDDAFKYVDLDFSDIDLKGIIWDYLDKYKEGKKNYKFIVFCETIEHIKKIKGQVRDWFNHKGYKVNCLEFHTGTRDNKCIDKFKKESKTRRVDLLLCINKANEGLHLNCVDGVILLRKTESPTVFYQQIGRIMSAKNKDTKLIFDFVNNTDCIMSIEDKHNTLREFKNQLSKTKIKTGKGKPKVSLSDFTFHDETKGVYSKLNDLLKSDIINNELVKNLALGKQEAENTANTNNSISVDDLKHNTNLSVSDMYKVIKNNNLSKEVVKTAYIYNSASNLADDIWMLAYNDLVSFINNNGRLPNKYDNSILYRWLCIQLRLHNSSMLDKNKIKLLKELKQKIK